MVGEFGRKWWLLALRGVLAIIFGILVFVMPGIALESLILVYAIYSIIGGVGTVFLGFNLRKSNAQWWVVVLEGVLGVIAGILALLFPGITALILLYIIAFWAILTGITTVVTAIQVRKEIEGEFWLGLSGVISIIFGVLLILFPGLGALSVLGIIGASSILLGFTLIMLAFRVKGYHDRITTATR